MLYADSGVSRVYVHKRNKPLDAMEDYAVGLSKIRDCNVAPACGSATAETVPLSSSSSALARGLSSGRRTVEKFLVVIPKVFPFLPRCRETVCYANYRIQTP